MQKHLHICFRGSVQGVGFRSTAAKLAHEYGLTGWVRNLSDGRVEVECEGAEEALKSFIAAISEGFKGYVTDIEPEWSPTRSEFVGFEVRR